MENNPIICQANELIKGRGDGRISFADTNILFENKLDSEENIKALFYIYDNFNLTDDGKEVFQKNILKWCRLYTIVKKNIS